MIEDARAHILEENARPPWLLYHANRTNIVFAAKSIEEIPRNYFEGYVLHWDEFRGHDWAIFVRNLARVIGLRCVVCSTNANVANCIDKEQSQMSRVH